MALVRFSLAILFILVLLALALVNQRQLAIDIWPLGYTISMPLFLWAIGVWLLGVVMGGTIVWTQKQALRRKINRLESDRRAAEKSSAKQAATSALVPSP